MHVIFGLVCTVFMFLLNSFRIWGCIYPSLLVRLWLVSSVSMNVLWLYRSIFPLSSLTLYSFLPLSFPLRLLAALFAGVYGDVLRVKILFNKKDSALIQMADMNQAQLGKTAHWNIPNSTAVIVMTKFTHQSNSIELQNTLWC